jgi:hypothetical protein
MNDAAWQDQLPRFVRTLQIIVAALAVGGLSFLAVARLVSQFSPPGVGAGGQTMTLVIAPIFLLGCLVARVVAPTMIVRNGKRKILRGSFQMPRVEFPLPQGQIVAADEARESLESMGDAGALLVLFQAKTIISVAIIEGATFFLLVVYLKERQLVAMGVAVALILAIVAHFPTRSGTVHWIEDQLRFLEDERSLER